MPARNAAGPELLKGFSLEMTGKDLPQLESARHAIPVGTKINVTFLASEELELRVKAAKAVKEMGFVPVPHISARCLRSLDELDEFLSRLEDIGATDHVFAVGGDPVTPRGPYPDALTIIRSGLLQEHGVREVSIAGYPEGHPNIPSELLWQHLETKASVLREEGLDTLFLTQFAFDTDPVIAWIQAVRERGLESPIRVGIPGPAGIKRLLIFARRFGVGANTMIVKKYGFSLTNLMGTAGPDRFVTELAERLAANPSTGRVGLHLYAFGGLLATSEWADEFIAARTEA